MREGEIAPEPAFHLRRSVLILIALAMAVSLLALLCAKLHSSRLIEQLSTGSPVSTTKTAENAIPC